MPFRPRVVTDGYRMKKFTVICLAILAACCHSCTPKDGDWDPIRLSKSEISFGTEGGTCTVEAKNYKSWWINDIRVTGTNTYYFPEPGDNRKVAGEGISAMIGTEENTVVITVSPSPDRHDWTVEMEAGDAFTSIRIRQN